MPELPEVETVRRDLEHALVGRRIIEVRLHGARTVRRHDPAELVASSKGRTVTGARRRGKYLLVDTDDGGALVIHLRMSGQLRLHSPADPAAAHTHAWFDLDDGHQLRFVDPRTFGELVWVPSGANDRRTPELARLGVDPLRDPPDERRLRELLGSRRLPLKGALLRQDLVAGIGNIYSDEIAFAARLRHDHRTDALTRRQLAALSEAMAQVIADAVAHRGSSLSDAQYVDLFGRPGGFQHHHQVYGRAGQPCPCCRRPLVRAAFAQRSTVGCRHCQR